MKNKYLVMRNQIPYEEVYLLIQKSSIQKSVMKRKQEFRKNQCIKTSEVTSLF